MREARIGPGGGLQHDREWALYSVDGRWVNGKRTAAIHLIRAEYSEAVDEVRLSVPGDQRGIPARTFAFPKENEEAAEWFSVYFEQVILVRSSENGFPDDPIANGPTIASRESVLRVGEWFPELTEESVRRRFRTTLELDGVPAFWEDRLFGADERSAVRFAIGEVAMEGSNPCARCPVPPRDPMTGENLDGFQKIYTQMRRVELPDWSPAERFDHFYRFATNTRVAGTETGKVLRVGDTLEMK